MCRREVAAAESVSALFSEESPGNEHGALGASAVHWPARHCNVEKFTRKTYSRAYSD